MTRKELFRTEAVDAQRFAALGSVSVVQPIRIWWITCAIVAASIAIVAFLAVGSYTRRTRVDGLLVPDRGIATVVAPVDGVVTEIAVEEGGEVVAGRRVAIVSVSNATAAAGDSLAAIGKQIAVRRDSVERDADAQRSMIDLQLAAMMEQRTAMGLELASLESEIAANREKVAIARELWKKLAQLQEGRFVSELQVKEKEMEVIERASALRALERQSIGIRREMAQADQSMRELPLRRGSNDAGRLGELAALDQELIESASSREVAILAPADGAVSVQIAKRGESIQAGQPILSVLQSNSRLEAELIVPSSAIGFVSQGDRVRLRYQAYPFQKFGQYLGTIRRVGRSAIADPGASSNTDSSPGSGRGDPVYKVVVELDSQYVMAYGKNERLMPGMSLQADILGERRSLIDWIFEPLYSLRGNVSDR